MTKQTKSPALAAVHEMIEDSYAAVTGRQDDDARIRPIVHD